MENQELHRSVLLDHEMVVDGVVLRERKELTNVKNADGLPESHLDHMRKIGDRSYVVRQISIDGIIQDEVIETTMAAEEIDAFKIEWEEKWHPSIGEQAGGIGHFFKKFLK